MKKILIFIIILVVLIGGFYFMKNINENTEPVNEVKTVEELKTMAYDWVETQAPTYLFDGMNLAFQEERALDLVGCENCYEFDFGFESRQAGFGNREGQMLAQVITPHTTTVFVENGEITRVITDGQFDEMKGEMLSENQEVQEDQEVQE